MNFLSQLSDLPTLVPCPVNYSFTSITSNVVVYNIATCWRGGKRGRASHRRCHRHVNGATGGSFSIGLIRSLQLMYTIMHVHTQLVCLCKYTRRQVWTHTDTHTHTRCRPFIGNLLTFSRPGSRFCECDGIPGQGATSCPLALPIF